MTPNTTLATEPSVKMGLFVYGTLRKNTTEQTVLTPRERGTIKGKLFSCGHFPAFIPDPNGIDVQGEIIESDHDPYLGDLDLQKLDRYEGYRSSDPEGSLYIRTTIDVHTNDNVRKCWVYVFNQGYNTLKEIKSGDWFNQ